MMIFISKQCYQNEIFTQNCCSI